MATLTHVETGHEVEIPATGGPEAVAAIEEGLEDGAFTIVGPVDSWVLQGTVLPTGGVHVEILDPEHWETGPALPEDQVITALELGFEPGNGIWSTEFDPSPGAAHEAAEFAAGFMAKAWN